MDVGSTSRAAILPGSLQHSWPQKKNGQEIPGIKCILTADLYNRQKTKQQILWTLKQSARARKTKDAFGAFKFTFSHSHQQYHICNYDTGTRGAKPVWQLLCSQNWLTQIFRCATRSSLWTGLMWQSRSCVFWILLYTSWELHIYVYTYLTAVLGPLHDSMFYCCGINTNKAVL